jgi:putative hydrolase of the HAD superfamily
MSRPELLLFDLGGVLIDNVAFERLSATPGIGLDPTEIKSKWLASSTVRSFELGAISAEAFARAFVEEWSLPVEPELFLADFAGWPKGFYPGVPELLRNLRQLFRVACLSNSNAVHWQWFGSLGDHFDVALSSHLLGEIKPDALCFERALQECRATPESVAFFDDSLENVLAARSLGLQAFHVCGLAEVNRALLQSGWLQ